MDLVYFSAGGIVRVSDVVNRGCVVQNLSFQNPTIFILVVDRAVIGIHDGIKQIGGSVQFFLDEGCGGGCFSGIGIDQGIFRRGSVVIKKCPPVARFDIFSDLFIVLIIISFDSVPAEVFDFLQIFVSCGMIWRPARKGWDRLRGRKSDGFKVDFVFVASGSGAV